MTAPLHERMEAIHDEYLKFERVVNPPSKRCDLCAFMLLDSLLPDTKDIIAAAEHDEIFLGVDADELNQVVSDEQLLTLVRCGMRHDSGYDCLAMFA